MNTKFNIDIMTDFTKQNGIYLASEAEKAQWEKDHTLVCPICGKTFIGYVNNPYPVAKEGLCCDDCNMWVIVIRYWLDRNHDWLKGMVDKLSHRRCSITSHCQINGESIVFTFYRELLSQELDVVTSCDDRRCQECFKGALRNWLTSHCSDKKIKDVWLMTECEASCLTFLAEDGYELPNDRVYNW